MANTFGHSKAKETSERQNDQEMNITENSSDKNQGDATWRPTDSPLESPTSEEFDEAEAKKRNESIKSETPGLTPDIGE